jgi:hypothetical protein
MMDHRTQVHKLYSELDEVKKMVKEGYEWRRVQDISDFT